ncbi:MAG: T9SS type A sorting domain-containing protein [Bacteroidia bacterium]|nr:T9SS type A sorting domain-containing protein [Bacteroidia bacterium]
MKNSILKVILPSCFFLFLVPGSALAQCTLSNGTSCVCPDTSSDCDLLPDITISWYALESYQSGPTEYSQTGNGANNGKLRISSSTPNIGYGPLEVSSIDASGNKLIVCGTDTFTVPDSVAFSCPNGQIPKQILRQHIYHRNGSAMTYREHLTPPMTYSNTSMYVDDWGIFSLRVPLANDPDPRNWPVAGYGRKRAFCLMNYGSCSTYSNHCKDTNTTYQQGTTLLNANFPNWGLGSNYNCSPVEQGIASGYTDIYSENLDGMWITIPPTTCNGNYWIYYEVDPHNYFEESNEDNNYTLIPFTLTLQNAPGNPVAGIQSTEVPVVCGTDSVHLMASAGFAYLWSNGATTQKIKAGPGSYSVTVTSYCGMATSDTFVVSSVAIPSAPAVTGDTVCLGNPATLSASGTNITWYDANDSIVGTGNTYQSPPLTSTTVYYARDININNGVLTNGGKPDSSGSGGYFTGLQSLLFTAYKPFILKSAKVYSNVAGVRNIEVYSSTGQLIESGLFYIPVGEYRVPMNFNIPVGEDFRITVNGTPDLWRSNGNVSYPYTISDTLSITGSTASPTIYYYFYDWEIEVGYHRCEGPKVAVSAEVEICAGIDPLAMNNMIRVYPVPAHDRVSLEITSVSNEDHALLKITDMAGRELYARELMLRTGEKQITDIDISMLPEGVFMLNLTISGNSYVRRLIRL